MIRFCRSQERQLVHMVFKHLPQNGFTKELLIIMESRLSTIHDYDQPKYAEGTKRFILILVSFILAFYTTNVFTLLYIFLRIIGVAPRLNESVSYPIIFFSFIGFAVVIYSICRQKKK